MDLLNTVNDLLTYYVALSIDAENKLFYLNPSSQAYKNCKRQRNDALSKKEVLEELLEKLTEREEVASV